MRRCGRCEQVKPLAAFRMIKKPQGRRLDSYCKPCRTALTREWRAKNLDRAREARAAEYAANREEAIAASVAWAKANPERAMASKRRWEQRNRQVGRNHVLRRRARKSAATIEVFTYAELLEHYTAMGYDGCAYCDGPHEHDDHIVPLSRGGAHALDNLAPACARCNLSKGSKLLAEWFGFIS